MPYAIRNQQGEITALLKEPAIGAEEFINSDSPEIDAFVNSDSTSTIQVLSDSDRGIARVTEDLIHLLITKNLILFTELPVPVQKKLLDREKLRSSLESDNNNFLDEEESI